MRWAGTRHAAIQKRACARPGYSSSNTVCRQKFQRTPVAWAAGGTAVWPSPPASASVTPASRDGSARVPTVQTSQHCFNRTSKLINAWALGWPLLVRLYSRTAGCHSPTCVVCVWSALQGSVCTWSFQRGRVLMHLWGRLRWASVHRSVLSIFSITVLDSKSSDLEIIQLNTMSRQGSVQEYIVFSSF